MPTITFEAGQLSTEVKEKLIKQLTDTSVEITGIPKHLFLNEALGPCRAKAYFTSTKAWS